MIVCGRSLPQDSLCSWHSGAKQGKKAGAGLEAARSLKCSGMMESGERSPVERASWRISIIPGCRDLCSSSPGPQLLHSDALPPLLSLCAKPTPDSKAGGISGERLRCSSYYSRCELNKCLLHTDYLRKFCSISPVPNFSARNWWEGSISILPFLKTELLGHMNSLGDHLDCSEWQEN